MATHSKPSVIQSVSGEGIPKEYSLFSSIPFLEIPTLEIHTSFANVF